MTSLPLTFHDRSRQTSNLPRLYLKNRYFEKNPGLSTEQIAMISRPGLRKFVETGDDGPIRGIYNAPGTFNEDIFVVSNIYLYRVSNLGVVTLVGTVATNPTGSPSMAAVQNIGTEPEKLWICDNGILYVYLEDGYGLGHLQRSGALTAGEQVEIDGIYYQWTAGSVDTGTPDGTSGNPWLVYIGASDAEGFLNLALAISATGTAGTHYSTALTEHTTVTLRNYTGTDLYIRAVTEGSVGNSITTTETMANGAWGAATLEDGGTPGLVQVPLPDDVGAISLGQINSYVIVIPAQGEGINGQFYWVNPGETSINGLDFATAERSPDAVRQVIIYSDMIWFCGQNTTEAWVPTGDVDDPFKRFQGVLFDRGTWEGTAVQVKDSLILVDENGAVFQIKGGLNRISTPDIEERIRRAISAENI